jgi:hypothetical protein
MERVLLSVAYPPYIFCWGIMTVGHVHRLHTRDGSDRGLDIGACSQAAPSCAGTHRLQPWRVWLSHRRAAAFPSMASLILAPLNLTAYCICTPPMHPSWWYLYSGDGLDAGSSASTPIWPTGCSSLQEKIKWWSCAGMKAHGARMVWQ